MICLEKGMAIALGDEMKGRTGMVIALGIGIHNIPEGMAIAAPLLMAKVSRLKILMQTLLVGNNYSLWHLIGKLTVVILPQLLPLLTGISIRYYGLF